jgi:hypothetical protein
MKSILDPGFRYVPSTSTDLRTTFARVRLEMQQASAQDPSTGGAKTSRVVPFVPFGRAKEASAQR